jgi:hypothetical protein
MDTQACFVTCQVTVRVEAADPVEAQELLLRKLRRCARRVAVDGAFSVEPQYVEAATTGHVWDVR